VSSGRAEDVGLRSTEKPHYRHPPVDSEPGRVRIA
jgi:hypothetical protein